ncbi:MAG: ABC transporter substrate-binding protein [Gemmataceae bacterium]|nr:ABC transporter substrate-binding protein [Gemmataceae bacterium]
MNRLCHLFASGGLCALALAALAPLPAPRPAVRAEGSSQGQRSRVPLREGQAPAPGADLPVVMPEDLARAAAKAPPAVAALYRDLSRPDPEAEPLYEEAALTRIEAFLAAAAESTRLTVREQLAAAETALAAVLRFHLSVRPRPVADADPPGPLAARLRKHLLGVRIQQLRALTSDPAQQDWAAAVALAERFLRAYPDQPAVLTESVRARTGLAGSRLLAGDFRTARQQIEWVEAHFRRDPSLKPPPRVTWLYRPDVASIRRALRERAQALLEQARALPDREAVERLEQALAAWPRLPGLYDTLLRRRHAYPVLYVGVRSLPEFLSPATARTDSERQAVELLFEGLFRATYDPAQGERYLPQLAGGAAAVIPGGRRVYLDGDAQWPGGERVTAADVRDTILYRGPPAPGVTPEWAAELLADPVLHDEHPLRIDFGFRQNYFAPLAPLTFKVLPRASIGGPRRGDDPAFAKKPLGSGPYVYAGRRVEDGRDCAVFTANPHYHRDGRVDRPFIREIRFYVPTDPARHLRDPQRPLHLLLDLPTARLRQLEQAGVKGLQTLRNRRVYILAVNHRVPALADQNLRRAFAHALDRDKILTHRFRGGEAAHQLLGVTGSVTALATRDLRQDVRRAFHRPANGPFPPGSWACCPPPRVPANLFDLDRARALARQAKGKVPRVTLTLKYPAGDPAVTAACQDIAHQLEALGADVGWSVKIKPVAVPERQLAEALSQQQYELAYWRLDHTNESYWLWPWFDGRQAALAPGGSNFLRYEDAALQSELRRAMGERNFAEVKRLTHEIHAHLHERMPLVPLWQLDTHVAVHPRLRPVHLDPLLIFDRVEDWKLAP